MKSQLASRPKEISLGFDQRYRITRSERLWVIHRVKGPNDERAEAYTILESIERSVYTLLLEGKNCVEWGGRLIELKDQHTEYVRFLNRMHPLHSSDEFKDLLRGAERGDFELQNNQAYDDEHEYGPAEILTLTNVAPFIFKDEKGPFA